MQNGPLRGPREYSLPNTIMEDTGRTALHEAATIGDEKTLHILLSGGSDRNIKDRKHGNTPLHEAAWRGFSRCVKALCALPQPKNGKDVKEGKIKGVLQDTRGALHSALLGTRNGGGFSALHLASQNGHNQSCREILLAGADPDVQNNYGDTPLHTACRYGHAGATRILISAKCDPNRTNLNGDTPLHIACAMGRRKLTRILLESGSNIEMKNAQDESPRDIAIRKNLREILEILNKPVPVPKPAAAKERDRSNSNSKSADKVDGSKSTGAKKKTTEENGANPANWSPYGCHYFPDPRSFPSPKLETLPKEPLGKGEQYYLDLAGNIRKGPIGVGNTCYCGPFFRHIEERISRNRKSIRKYVHKATERLDNKVQALALRTDDQIEQITRSMIADRIRCEGRRLHLEQWLRRGEPGRLTVGHHSKSKKNIENVNTLTRCRSLELLDDDNLDGRKIQNSKSFDLLDETEVIVHRGAEASSSVLSSGLKNSDKSKDSSAAGMQRDSFSVSERLEELLAKTNEILEMERIVRRRRKDKTLVVSSKKTKDKMKGSTIRHLLRTDEIIDQLQSTSIGNGQSGSSKEGSKFIAEEMEKITSSLLPKESPKTIQTDRLPPLSPEISKDYASQKEYDRKSDQEQEQSSILSESSHRNPSSAGSGYVPDFGRKGNNHQLYQSSISPQYNRDYQNIMEAHEEDTEIKFKNLITALRKDYHSAKMVIETELAKDSSLGDDTENNSPYSNYEQSTIFDDDDHGDMPKLHEMLNGFYQNDNFDDLPSSSSNTLKSEKRQIHDQDEEMSELANVNEINELKSRILNGSNWRSQVLKKSQQMTYDGPDESPEINSTVQKVEIKNSEIKTLKSPTSGILKRSKVQELVAKIQGVPPNHKDSGNQSESSEDEQDGKQHSIPNGTAYYYNRPQPQVPYQNGPTNLILPAINNVQTTGQIIDTRTLIPKDAYFHELPNRNRMRPIADKLPEKQMLNFNEQFQTARTRNPLPYEYEIGITEPNPIQYIPHREKLLTSRKFTFSSAVDYELSRIHTNQQEQPLMQQTAISITPEQAQIERDMNNDSGYSTKICGSSHGPSPSLSGHTDYGTTDPSGGAVPYFLSNIGASSLV